MYPANHPLSWDLPIETIQRAGATHAPSWETSIFPAGWWFEPLWKIWKSIGMMKFPIFMGKCQKWQPVPTNQPGFFHSNHPRSSLLGAPGIRIPRDPRPVPFPPSAALRAKGRHVQGCGGAKKDPESLVKGGSLEISTVLGESSHGS